MAESENQAQGGVTWNLLEDFIVLDSFKMDKLYGMNDFVGLQSLIALALLFNNVWRKVHF